MSKLKSLSFGVPAFAFLLMFILLPMRQLNGLESMPGALGDSRLNNYFLENIFLFFSGEVKSLWHMGFYDPFPYVAGLSDNHFGSALPYLMARWTSFSPHTSFQIWFYLGYFCNFSAAYWCLKKYGFSTFAASFGALIFAFGLPASAHVSHVQLHYRFGIPFAIFFLSKFLNSQQISYFFIAALWTIWQLYCGIYMGFFLGLMLASMLLTFLLQTKFQKTSNFKAVFSSLGGSFQASSGLEKIYGGAICVGMLGALALLFYPYFQVSTLYGAGRNWTVISAGLPRLESYFLNDRSAIIFTNTSNIFSSDIPKRYEHQMFFGLIPIMLGAYGVFVARATTKAAMAITMLGTIGGVILFTLNIYGFSLWYAVHKLPLFSAIRVMTRIDQALLFPVAYLACLGLDNILRPKKTVSLVVSALVVFGFVTEASLTKMKTSSKQDWIDRNAKVEGLITRTLLADTVIFAPQQPGPHFFSEIDIMWLALKNGMKTANGYTGSVPPGYKTLFGDNCAELPRRVLAYQKFRGTLGDLEEYRQLMAKRVPLGFSNCRKEWWTEPTNLTPYVKLSYDAESFAKLRLLAADVSTDETTAYFKIDVINSGPVDFKTRAVNSRPIRLSSRLRRASDDRNEGWKSRHLLPEDLKAMSQVSVTLEVDLDDLGEEEIFEVSIVQEQEFWGHNIGIAPVQFDLNAIAKMRAP